MEGKAVTAAQRGAYCEQYAAKALVKAGYGILARNFHSRCGELDIIAKKDDIIAFVEVKARGEDSMVSGFAAVTKSKRRRIIATAFAYIDSPEGEAYKNYQPRFDVIAVITGPDGAILSHDHLEGAFDCEAFYSGH